MARVKQRGKSGAAKNFITRNQALKRLQVTLADFRRLCILKGIYPREPRNKKKANKGSSAPATFYYTKDIQYLLHEPIIGSFRQHKTFAKRLSKTLGRNDYYAAKRLSDRRPVYQLDHIVKERYPTFFDALRDLDDALSMVFLFANMPVAYKVGSEVIANCERLAAEFQHYVISSHSLRKVFLSVKGIYYQADIMGQDVTWVVPYKFSQRIPDDVDFRIMITFLEFYQTFLSFVNYKLYNNIGLVYPPTLNIERDEKADGIGAYEIKRAELPQIKAADGTATNRKSAKETKKRAAALPDSLVANDMKHANEDGDAQEVTNVAEESQEENVDPFTEADGTSEVTAAKETRTDLFSGLTFYLSRETPRYTLEFVIRSFQGNVSWDLVLGGEQPLQEDSEQITHHIVDRPTVPHLYPNRSYVQPQWVYDCVNHGTLLDTADYLPGELLPPHLSPFVHYETGVYNPQEALEGAREEESESEMAHADGREQEADDVSRDTPGDSNIADVPENDLEAEAAGIPYSQNKAAKDKAKKPNKAGKKELSVAEKEDADAKEMAISMMSNKNKKLYNRMKHSNQKKEARAASLTKRRKEIEKERKQRKSN